VFESASYFDFNPSITEHANFNFAKLCYELGYPYNDPTMILQDFINNFPDSEYIDETYSYLVNAFLTHKDYVRELNLWKKMACRTSVCSRLTKKCRITEPYNYLTMETFRMPLCV
jgi:hypothetical protein